MSGARIRYQNAWRTLADPRRHPQYTLHTALRSPGHLLKKMKLFRWIAAIAVQGPGPIPAGHTVAEELERASLSGPLVDTFIKPWLAGITLDNRLRADAGATKAYISGFIHGPAALPRGGMRAIPQQLAKTLPTENIRLNTSVRKVSAEYVTLEDGTVLPACRVIIAADGPSQNQLITRDVPPSQKQSSGVSALHIALPTPAPVHKPWLLLPGEEANLIASISFPSLVAPGYAPAGSHLATIAVLDGGSSAELWPAVQSQLKPLLGNVVDSWRLLRPSHSPSTSRPTTRCPEPRIFQ